MTARFVAARYVLDTCTLLDFLALQHQYDHRRRWPDPHFYFTTLRTEPDRGDFHRLLSLRKGHLITSSAVVAELYGAIKRAHQREHPARQSAFKEWCWTFLCRTFRESEISEPETSLTRLPPAAVVILGPVDVGVIELAKASIRRGEPVNLLTGDEGIRKHCLAEGVSAPFVIDHLRELFY